MAIDGRLEPYREISFPNLGVTGYRVTSPTATAYNCFAWAAGEDDDLRSVIDQRWWNPLEPESPYYWVDGVPAELTIEAFVRAYGTLGFLPCDGSDLEAGFEKIALYATPDGEPTHAARQLSNGKWTSKLGRWQDIEHEV